MTITYTPQQLDVAKARVTEAMETLRRARAAARYCPSAPNLAAEEEAEELLDIYLDRLPRG